MTTGRSEARIDLAAITANTRRLDELAGDAGVMAVVKADGYGHGLLPSARAVLEGGAAWLGVAFLEEALAIRAAGIDAPLLAWLFSPQEDLAPAVAAGVDLGIYDEAELAAVQAAARATGRHGPGAPQGRHRAVPRRRPARGLAGPVRRGGAGRGRRGGRGVEPLRVRRRRAGPPGQPRAGGRASPRRSRSRAGTACTRRCGTWPTAPPRSPRPRRTTTWSGRASRSTACRRCRSSAARPTSGCGRR